MALSIRERPFGLFLTNRFTTCTIFNSGGNTILSFPSPHGFASGVYTPIYIESNVSEYSGYRWVFFGPGVANTDVVIYFDYFIKSISNVVAYIPTYHTWNCVHLPIAYKLISTLWPTNSEDTIRTVSSVTDSNGYCALSLSGDIKSTGSASALEFVKITGATDDDLNGVWQIINYTNDTTFTVNIPYSSANDTAITNASIQYYYNNYVVKVQVWGGLNNGHVYYGQKPYELLATLDILPDEDNAAKFSIHEILKNQIKSENDLMLGTLPNNLDAWTGFFIKYAEVYDDSDGTTLTQITASYTSDMNTFEGKAVNSILAFKNVFAGAMSEYVLSSSSELNFLTNAATPVLFSGHYFDLSLLWDGVKTLIFLKEWYLNNSFIDVTGEEIDAFYTGVYRGQIEYTGDCDDYNRVDVTAMRINTTTFQTPNTWTALTSGGAVDYDVRTSDYFEVAEAGSPFPTRQAYQAKSVPNGTTLTAYVRIVITNYTSSTAAVNFLLNTTAVIAGAQGVGFTYSANGEYFERVSITSTQANQFLIIQSDPGNIINIKIYLLEAVSEIKTIDLNCDCIQSKATGYYISWLNNLGGFEYWYFTAYSDKIINITNSGETKKNIFPEWPNSYGEFSDTIRKQTYRESQEQVLVRSQHLTEAQVEALKSIKTSPLVQIINSIYDRRTVLVDTDSFIWLKEGNNLHELSFTITYTDDVPSQSV